jgi:hypothetical protein
MKKSFLASALFIAVSLYFPDINAQCSDAGICQIGGYLTEEATERFNLSISYKYGYSGKEDDIEYHSILLNGNYKVLDNSSVQFLIPYNNNRQASSGLSISGIGDLILSWNQKFFSDKNSSFSASGGIKLATGDDNVDYRPQPLQSGLGTNDILIGINYSYDRISLGVGYQHPVGRNDNLYRLKRSDDILVKTSYQLSFDLLSIIPQLLYIQPLGKSSIIDLSSSADEIFIDVDKTGKPQLNLLTEVSYRVSENFSLIGDFAVPFIKREINLDGLTRAFSASFGLSYFIN